MRLKKGIEECSTITYNLRTCTRQCLREFSASSICSRHGMTVANGSYFLKARTPLPGHSRWRLRPRPFRRPDRSDNQYIPILSRPAFGIKLMAARPTPKSPPAATTSVTTPTMPSTLSIPSSSDLPYPKSFEPSSVIPSLMTAGRPELSQYTALVGWARVSWC